MSHNNADEGDEEPRPRFPYVGATVDNGKIVIDRHLRGRLWRGHAGERPVLMVHRAMSYERHKALIDSWLRFDVPGVATLEYLGFPDDGGTEVAIVEARPSGMPIAECAPLSAQDVLQCGIGMCDALLTWGQCRESLIAGFRPETVYVEGGRYSGMVPRIGVLGYDQDWDTFDSAFYTAPSGEAPYTLTLDDAGFIAAQVLWFALLREHPYKFPGALNEDENIWHDRRRPFTGPAELGTILEAVLVADPTRRLGVRGFRDQLARLGGVP